ncbi:MAG: nuclear transport factor 2 family protein [Pseudonocardiaceae bacterium]
MKHDPPRTPSTARVSAATKTAGHEEANLEVVEGFFAALVKNKDPEAVAGYLADDFISHSLKVAGKQGMVDFAAWQAATQPEAGFVEVFHTVAKGDLVVKHYTYSNDPANGAELTIADFFRVKDGKICEYWDVVAPIDAE